VPTRYDGRNIRVSTALKRAFAHPTSAPEIPPRIGLMGGFVPHPSAMALTVKICGLSTEETVDAALDTGADMVGFVLFPKSPRNVPVERAASLAARARNRADIVLLTVDMELSRLAEAVAAVRPGFVQMHGAETPEAVAAVQDSLGLKAIKVLPVGTRADLDAAARYDRIASMLMLDAKPPQGADRPGGHGRVFDWTLLSGFVPAVPYILSGGLTAENVAEAIRISGAQGVDVSSGVETSPGRKDPELIRRFIAAAREAQQTPERVA
jgi:phosphoribosylanthranilate isomerase